MQITVKMATKDLLASLDQARCGSRLRMPDLLAFIGRLLPWLAWSAVALCALGFHLGLSDGDFNARHGALFPIILVHLPATLVSVGLYLLMAFWAGAGLLFGSTRFAMMAQALAPTGAVFALIALSTGSLWGKPTTGAWWDARMTAELVLLMLFLAVIAFRIAIEDARRADRIVALVALPGTAAVPVILSTAVFWPEFHQPSLALAGPTVSSSLQTGLLVLFAGYWMYATAVVLRRLRCELLERERLDEWVTRCTGGSA